MKVMDELGINRKVFIGRVKDKSNPGIFFKLKDDNTARILVSQTYTNKKWTALGILFHELGHYINDHENFCSNKELELDADYYAGYCLSRAGADSEQALESLSILPEEGDESHPPKKDRIQRILAGWNAQKKSRGINSFTSISPNVIWKTLKDSVIVDIDNQFIKFGRTKYMIYNTVNGDTTLVFDPEFGILYIKSSNSTYQLLDYNYKKGNEGLGELINDRTTLVYLRYNEKNFRYYNKGAVILQQDTKLLGWNKGNYLVSYKGKEISFKNYLYVPFKKLMPAFYR